MHSFKCCDNFFLFCHIIIFFRILSVSGLTFHHEVIEKKQKMKFTFTQVRLIKMSKKQFVGFRAGRPGFLLGGVYPSTYCCRKLRCQRLTLVAILTQLSFQYGPKYDMMIALLKTMIQHVTHSSTLNKSPLPSFIFSSIVQRVPGQSIVVDHQRRPEELLQKLRQPVEGRDTDSQ